MRCFSAMRNRPPETWGGKGSVAIRKADFESPARRLQDLRERPPRARRKAGETRTILRRPALTLPDDEIWSIIDTVIAMGTFTGLNPGRHTIHLPCQKTWQIHRS
jgi:hypothetical protein